MRFDWGFEFQELVRLSADNVRFNEVFQVTGFGSANAVARNFYDTYDRENGTR